GGGAQFVEERRRLAAVAEFLQQRPDRRLVRERAMGILLVRNAGTVESLAQRRRLSVGAVQNGEIGERAVSLWAAHGSAALDRARTVATHRCVDGLHD